MMRDASTLLEYFFSGSIFNFNIRLNRIFQSKVNEPEIDIDSSTSVVDLSHSHGDEWSFNNSLISAFFCDSFSNSFA